MVADEVSRLAALSDKAAVEINAMAADATARLQTVNLELKSAIDERTLKLERQIEMGQTELVQTRAQLSATIRLVDELSSSLSDITHSSTDQGSQLTTLNDMFREFADIGHRGASSTASVAEASEALAQSERDMHRIVSEVRRVTDGAAADNLAGAAAIDNQGPSAELCLPHQMAAVQPASALGRLMLS